MRKLAVVLLCVALCGCREQPAPKIVLPSSPVMALSPKDDALIVSKAKVSKIVVSEGCPEGYVEMSFSWQDPEKRNRFWYGSACIRESFVKSQASGWTESVSN